MSGRFFSTRRELRRFGTTSIRRRSRNQRVPDVRLAACETCDARGDPHCCCPGRRGRSGGRGGEPTTACSETRFLCNGAFRSEPVCKQLKMLRVTHSFSGEKVQGVREVSGVSLVSTGGGRARLSCILFIAVGSLRECSGEGGGVGTADPVSACDCSDFPTGCAGAVRREYSPGAGWSFSWERTRACERTWSARRAFGRRIRGSHIALVDEAAAVKAMRWKGQRDLGEG